MHRIERFFRQRVAQFAGAAGERGQRRGTVDRDPNIREPILTGDAEITGDFKFEEASLLALALRTGALPVPMTIEEERTIGPLLGKDSIEAGIHATILGGILIVLFMIGYFSSVSILKVIYCFSTCH